MKAENRYEMSKLFMQTSFSLHVFQIKDCHSCGFTACTSCGGNLHMQRQTNTQNVKTKQYYHLKKCIYNNLESTRVACTSDEWLQCPCNGFSFSNWRIHKVQKFCVWVRCIQVGGFAGVNHRTPSHSNIHIKMSLFGKSNRFFKTVKRKSS